MLVCHICSNVGFKRDYQICTAGLDDDVHIQFVISTMLLQFCSLPSAALDRISALCHYLLLETSFQLWCLNVQILDLF